MTATFSLVFSQVAFGQNPGLAWQGIDPPWHLDGPKPSFPVSFLNARPPDTQAASVLHVLSPWEMLSQLPLVPGQGFNVSGPVASVPGLDLTLGTTEVASTSSAFPNPARVDLHKHFGSCAYPTHGRLFGSLLIYVVRFIIRLLNLLILLFGVCIM